MHYLMLVTITCLNGATSLDARCEAQELLQKDDSFCGEGGRFGCPLCDWFVLGGRWSGMLREAILGQPYKDALEQEFPEFAKGFYPSKLAEQHKTSLDQLWQRFGGTGSSPFTRSGYDELGADDDAMPVDQFLYDHFLKPYAGTDSQIGDDTLANFADLDGDEVDESFIGRKWLVLVDYHN
jgi:hypothetical protein